MTSGRCVQTKTVWFLVLFGFFFCVRVLVWEDLVLLFYCNMERCAKTTDGNYWNEPSKVWQCFRTICFMGTVAALHWNSSLKYHPWDRMSSFSFCRLLLPHWKTCSWQCQQGLQEPQPWAVLWRQSQGLSLRPKAQGLHFSPVATTRCSLLAQDSQPDPALTAGVWHTRTWIIPVHPKGTLLLTFYTKWRPSNSLACTTCLFLFSLMPSLKDIVLFPRSKRFPFCFHFIEKCFPYWLKLLLFLKGTQSSSKWSKAWFFEQWEAGRKRTMSIAVFSLFSDIKVYELNCSANAVTQT